MRRRLTYANVMSTVLVIAAVTGATAFATTQLGKKTVGTKQLKANAVTAAKIKKNAVTGAKIKTGAVDSSKVKDSSLTGADIDAASTPFGRPVAKFSTGANLAVTPSFQVYPLGAAGYTQAADEVNFYGGYVDVTVPAECVQPRQVVAEILVDAKNPLAPQNQEIAGLAFLLDSGSGIVSRRLDISSSTGTAFRLDTGTSQTRTVTLIVQGSCTSGGGITASGAGVGVFGVR